MPSLSWLHLTDLHVGQAGLAPLFPALHAAFLEDLGRVHDAVGPIHLLLFSGDLVYSGRPEEYAQLDEVLGRLYRRLGELGSNPLLLAVPGNHDVRWPDRRSPVLRALLHWVNDPELQDLFWRADDTAGDEYRALVTHAFEGYTTWQAGWRARNPLPPWATLNEAALLPGEFAATVEPDGLRLGVVGLNSAFLHLGQGVEPGRLDLDPRQLNTVTGGDPGEWAEAHHAAFLMTHHPPEWLSPAALARYQGEIMAGTWFAGHLCGHLHDTRAVSISLGGGPVHRLIQCASIFGLERFDGPGGREEDRVHGYAAAKVELADDGWARLSAFPRRAMLNHGRRYFAPDVLHFQLDGRSAYEERFRARVPRVVAPGSSRGSKPAIEPQPPGLGYDPAWYVERDAEERQVLLHLRAPGAPIIVRGSDFSGKSTFLRRIAAEVAREGEAGLSVHFLDLSRLPEAARAEPAALLRALAERMMELHGRSAGLPEATIHTWVEEAWDRPGPPDRKLERLVEQRLLGDEAGRVVLILDCVESLMGRGADQALFRVFRHWVDNGAAEPSWRKLRLVLAVAPIKTYFDGPPDPVSDFFNLVISVRLEPFGVPHLAALARLYGDRWTLEELGQLERFTGGSPYLARLVFYLERLGVSKVELLDPEALESEHFARPLQQMWLRLRADPPTQKAFCAFLRAPDELSPDQRQRLLHVGLARRGPSGLSVQNDLLAAYVKARC